MGMVIGKSMKIIYEWMIFHCTAMFQRVRWIGHGLILGGQPFLEPESFGNPQVHQEKHLQISDARIC